MVLVITMIRVEVKNSRVVQEQVKAVPPQKLFTLPLIAAYILAFGDYLYLGFDITLMPLWMHDHLGASVAMIGFYYVAWAIPSIITAPIGGRIADRRRRSMMILIFGLAQVPFYIVYGLANVAIIILGLFIIHSVIYSFIQPAVDAHLATSSPTDARARIQGMYTAAGLIGAFAAANGFSLLYTLNFRLPLFAIGASYGLCVLIGGTLVRISESRGLVSGPKIHGKDKQNEQEEIVIASEQV
jgi:MFS family permease